MEAPFRIAKKMGDLVVAVPELRLVDPAGGEPQQVALAELIDAPIHGPRGAVEGREEAAEAGESKEEVVDHGVHDALLV